MSSLKIRLTDAARKLQATQSRGGEEAYRQALEKVASCTRSSLEDYIKKHRPEYQVKMALTSPSEADLKIIKDYKAANKIKDDPGVHDRLEKELKIIAKRLKETEGKGGEVNRSMAEWIALIDYSSEGEE